jgi:hypothetical protein
MAQTMKRIQCVLLLLLSLAALGLNSRASAALRASPAKVTCNTCPLRGIDPHASKRLANENGFIGGPCSIRVKNGYPLPDARCSPGAINPTITLTVLKDPEFRTGCIRDCTTTGSQKANTYGAYGIAHPSRNNGSTQTCELDHVVPLELGGADTLDNIWPQCGPTGAPLPVRFFKEKDIVENYLAAEVKSGRRTLIAAQKGVAADWTQYLEQAKADCELKRCATER